MERGEKISIPTKDISEPVFQHGPGGARNIVAPLSSPKLPMLSSTSSWTLIVIDIVVVVVVVVVVVADLGNVMLQYFDVKIRR